MFEQSCLFPPSDSSSSDEMNLKELMLQNVAIKLKKPMKLVLGIPELPTPPLVMVEVIPAIVEVAPEPTKNRTATRLSQKKSAPEETVPAKPLTKKLKAVPKGFSVVSRADDDDFMVISP